MSQPSTVAHPQTKGQSERAIQILEDMLRACILDFRDNWKKCLPLAKFARNNGYQSTIVYHPLKSYMVGYVDPHMLGRSWRLLGPDVV